MIQNAKQALHIESGKSFSRGEANENERRWDDRKIDLLNKDSANNYDATRMRLNFEIGPDGKIHPLGYMDKRLDERLQERLDELGYHPFKADSKIQPNICAKIIIGGNHERTLEMAFGKQEVDLEKGADNSSLRRCREVEDWAMDSYRWCCEQFGRENVIGFQVHLDEKSPHCHALVVPVGRKGKAKSERVMWSAKFGKDGNGYKAALHAMHTSLYETVSRKYGLERGDSIEGRDVRHLDKHEFYSEQYRLQKTVKSLQTMMKNLESQVAALNTKLVDMKIELDDGRMTLEEYRKQKEDILKQTAKCEASLKDKTQKLHQKEEELKHLTEDAARAGKVMQPFRNHKATFDPPQITEKVPLFGAEKWLERQNQRLAKEFKTVVDKVEALYMADAEQQVKAAQCEVLADYNELYRLKGENKSLWEAYRESESEMNALLEDLALPEVRDIFLAAFDILIGGKAIPAASGGGGSTSDLAWDGRRRDEDEEAYRRRCLRAAMGVTKFQLRSYRKR
ncbi:MAG: plasmid recombination protein [Bacteroidales bacterium]|nr:plasmid recombination protein [Bacteroidales bacterium]